MTLLQIKDALPFQSTEDRVRILAMLPHESLLPLVRHAAQQQDVAWLSAMSEGGLLDVPDSAYTASPQQDEEEARQARPHWVAIAKAMVDFLQDITPAPRVWQDNAGEGPMDIDVSGVASFKAGDIFKEWFAGAALRLLRQIKEICRHPAWNGSNAEKIYLDVLGRWAMGACVLDLPETLQCIVQAFPQAMETTIGHENLGSFLRETVAMTGWDMQVNALYLALQTSSVACMQVLQDASHDKVFELGRRKSRNSSEHYAIASFTLADNLTRPSFGPVCSHEAFTHALGVLLKRPGTASVVQEEALNSMSTASKFNMQVFLPSFIAAGAFNGVAEKAAQTACERGFVRVLHAVKDRVRWDDLSESVLYDTLSLSDPTADHHTHQAVHTLLGMAIDKGHGERFARLHIRTDHHNNAHEEPRLEPLQEAIRKNAFGVVRELLEFNAIDPSMPMAPGQPSAIALADHYHEEMADKLRSLCVRQKAMSLIALIGLDQTATRPAP